MKEKKTVYLAMSADLIHSGHIGIIEEAAKYGELTVGILSDKAVASYRRAPVFDYETRNKIISNIKNVSRTVRQETLDYTENLMKLKPDYVMHGDNWKVGVQSIVRQKVIETLGQWGGKLIEVPYDERSEFIKMDAEACALFNTPDIRRKRLKTLLGLKPYIRAMEASNGLSGLIVENTTIEDERTASTTEYDAIWISSLCDSTFKGKPDIELVDITSRINTINEIMEVTTKPMILDGDTGGRTEHFTFNVRTLERLGVSAVIIEDKTGPKHNSLFGADADQILEDPVVFANKIAAGKKAQVTGEFMIFARLESLIAGAGIEDALQRAKMYIKAGADGIMIHSQKTDGKEVAEFLKEFRKYSNDIPVIVAPTSYNHMTEQELNELGANIIIYANHLLRSAYPAMLRTARKILECGRSKEVDGDVTPIKEIITLIPGERQV
ncbi:MAG: phosphoenolpyruvate mutase [Methanomassiliicoccaceae archaeon]|nr:phosphoenolpyruvate mutase [Methanomassiliicoccaceae archaeon]